MPAPRRNWRQAGWLVVTSLTFAGVQAQSASEYFHVVDRNRDDRLSLSEYQDWMTRAFHDMDRNHDEILEPHEQLVPNSRSVHLSDLHNRLATQFNRQDVNHDGWLTAKEYLAPPQ